MVRDGGLIAGHGAVVGEKDGRLSVKFARRMCFHFDKEMVADTWSVLCLKTRKPVSALEVMEIVWKTGGCVKEARIEGQRKQAMNVTVMIMVHENQFPPASGSQWNGHLTRSMSHLVN